MLLVASQTVCVLIFTAQDVAIKKNWLRLGVVLQELDRGVHLCF